LSQANTLFDLVFSGVMERFTQTRVRLRGKRSRVASLFRSRMG